MSVLIVIENTLTMEYPASSRAMYLAKAFREKGVATTVIGREPEGGTPRCNNENVIAIHSLCGGRLGKVISRVLIFLTVFNLMRRREIRFVILRGHWLGLVLFPLLKIFNVRFFYDFHGYRYTELKKEGKLLKARAVRSIERFIELGVTDYITVIAELGESLTRHLGKRCFILPNGLDLDEFSADVDRKQTLQKIGLSENDRVISFVGNWEAWMSIEDLLRANEHLDGVNVIVIGRGPNFERYVNEFKKIHFLGKIPHPEVVMILKCSDIGILPYSRDLLLPNYSSRKTLEYMAASLPIIVSRVKERERFLIDQESCVTYEPGNPEDLAEKVHSLLAREDIVVKMRDESSRLAEKFTWKVMLEKSGILSEMGYD